MVRSLVERKPSRPERGEEGIGSPFYESLGKEKAHRFRVPNMSIAAGGKRHRKGRKFAFGKKKTRKESASRADVDRAT